MAAEVAVVRPEPQSLLKVLHRLRAPAQLQQGLAQVFVSVGEVRFHAQRLLDVFNSLLRPAGFAQRRAETVARPGISGPQTHRLLEMPDRLGKLTGSQTGDT